MFNVVQERELPLAQQVAQQINQLILDRELTIGERLPNEFELATELNVGRGTVREAVKILVARNVLTIQRGKGTFVAKHPGRVDDPLGFMYIENKEKLVADLLDVRMRIEPWVASLAAQNATPEDIMEIVRRCDTVEACIQHGDPHLEEDIKLHIAIARATNNLVVPSLIPVINQSVNLFVELTRSSLGEETIVTHRKIVRAITAHEPQTASEAMMEHIEFNRSRLKIFLEQEAKADADKA